MRRVLLVAAVVLLALPASALGATRYASPAGGATGSCGQADPCSLTYAVTGATGGDEVIVTPGEYPVAETIEATVPLTIRAVAGAARPRIVGAPEVTPFEVESASTVSGLAIEATEATSIGATVPGVVLERLELTAVGKDAVAAAVVSGVEITNSLMVARGPDPVGLFELGFTTDVTTLRNDTIVAEGEESAGILAIAVAPVAIQATDVIAVGDTSAGASDMAPTSIAFDHSDLQGQTEGNVTITNAVTSPPRFVAAAGGNFREAAGSPTIDAGVNDPANGATDLDGNPRSLPGRLTCTVGNPPAVTDIGAYEFVPTAPPCVPTPTPPSSSLPPGTVLLKSKIHGGTATFRFGGLAAPATGFECKLDAKPWRKCSSPRTYKHLRPGFHTFRVRAVGADGADGTPIRRKFKIHRPRRHLHHHGVS